ncbi:glycine cleavage system protein GcvH [Streptomyces sp. M19]
MTTCGVTTCGVEAWRRGGVEACRREDPGRLGMVTPNDRRYTREHQWVLPMGGGLARVGITAYAARRLGDLVLVELPDVQRRYGPGEEFGTVESVKAVSGLHMPVTGKVIAVNEALRDDPGAIDDDPYGEGWIVQLALSDAKELNLLLSAPEYDAACADERGE